MKYEVFNLREEPVNDFMPKLIAYLLDDCRCSSVPYKRPAVVICPGGAYAGCSPREGEPIALQYMAAGYHAFVLDYAVAPNRHPEALKNASDAICFIRKHADKWGIETDKIVIMGFSAGGHLAASLATMWDEEPVCTPDKSNRPNAAVLGYPVISAEAEITHKESFINLCGEDPVLQERLSLENRVTSKTPPCFIWHTFEDQAVPVDNSICFAKALVAAGVNCELHIFPHGVHGLALANDDTAMSQRYIDKRVQAWVHLSVQWLDGLFGRNQ